MRKGTDIAEQVIYFRTYTIPDPQTVCHLIFLRHLLLRPILKLCLIPRNCISLMGFLFFYTFQFTGRQIPVKLYKI